MTEPLRLFRLWRTSGLLCVLGALEFGYVAYARHTWWPLIITVGLFFVAGLAFRKARLSRRPQ
jgi:hypothetical protein